MYHTPLYDRRNLRMAPIDVDADALVVAVWSYAPQVVSQIREESANPLTVIEVTKILGNWKRSSEDGGRSFAFALRPQDQDRLVGLLRLNHVEWVHGAGLLSLVFGDPQDWEVFGREAVQLALNYAFDELNLFRVTVRIAEDDTAAAELFREAQFYLEVRQREAIFRDGRYLDRLSFGMLRPEWEVFRSQEVAR